MSRQLRIAIDGPSGAGKSTVAKRVAEELDLEYIDTGAMYRAVGYKMIRDGISLEDRDGIKKMLETTDIDFDGGDTLLDGQVINEKIRSEEISKMASDASALLEVREKLVALQKKMGQTKSLVMDGRDIGTNVMTDAEYKFYLTAAPGERAARRYKEYMEKGLEVTLDSVEADIKRRDENDMNRPINPLRKAEDGIEIDSTDMSADQVVKRIVNLIKESKKAAEFQ